MDLSGLKIDRLPPEIGALTALQTLRLQHNQLTTLPPEIGALTALQTLWLDNNQLTTLPPEIGALTELQTLWLHNNQLTTLPPEIGALAALQVLWLDQNQLTTLPPEIGTLTALQKLNIDNNRLTVLPPEIAALTALQRLDLYNNQIIALPPEIAALTALRRLLLINNHLTALPAEIAALTALQEIYLHNNPLLRIPDEVLGPDLNMVLTGIKPQPAREILRYYLSTLGGARQLREIKLMLVGRGEVGKSTLVDALQGRAFKRNRPRTDGIAITPWQINPKGGKAIVRIWDFGGQEIMHGTHQFFLTQRAIYIVLVDGRDNRSMREAEYWLKHVRAFGGNSTVLVVMNRQENYKFDLDRNVLAAKYSVDVDHFFPTECSEPKTVAPVRKVIKSLVAEILAQQKHFPAKWWPIKEALEQLKRDYLTDGEYRELCMKQEIHDVEEQGELLDRLNDLGVIVHFGDDDGLAEIKVLAPEWATDGVYRVITNEVLREQKHGKLNAKALREILPGKRWPEPRHRRYVIDLMQRFDLCFPAEGAKGVYIVPELLPKKTPALSDWKAKECVVFRYTYPILPQGVIPRFISKSHSMSEGRQRWRTGVVLEHDDAEALVRADEDASTIDIWVRGTHRDTRRALLAIIRAKFDEIHQGFKGLNPEELVGVPEHPSVFASYSDMILDERAGVKTTRVTIDGERSEIELDHILSGVESPERRAARNIETRRQGNKVVQLVHVYGNYHERGDSIMTEDNSINIGGDVVNSQVAHTMEHCTNLVQNQPEGPKRELLEQLQAQVREILQHLPAEKRSEAPTITEELEQLVKQATSERPNRRWYSVSAEGLLEAAGWVKDFSGNILGTLGQLGKLIWPDFDATKLQKSEHAGGSHQ